MSSDFVRYSEEIETFDRRLSQYLERIIHYWETKVRESPAKEGSGRAVRGAHAKTIGVVRAEVEILSDVPAPYAQGVYAVPGRHDALIRFSNASNHLGVDAQLGPVLGFPIKIFDVGGTKLVDDEPDATTFDLVLKNHPTDLQVQLCTDLKAMPGNDSTVEWPEKLSSYVTVGRVHIPRQDISAPENSDMADALAFNQWRVTAEHRPLGEIMDVRRIYTASAKVRREINHQSQREPVSADEVLPLPKISG